MICNDRRIVSYVLSEHNDTPSPDLTDPTDTSTGEKNIVPALIGGVTRLRDGTMELSDGLKEFDEQGVQKLVDAFAGDLSGLMDRVDAVKAVPERYNSFSGISPDMDGQTKIV